MRVKAIRMQMKGLKIRNVYIPKCSDCGVGMIRSSNELMCPKCGLVKDMIEGSD